MDKSFDGMHKVYDFDSIRCSVKKTISISMIVTSVVFTYTLWYMLLQVSICHGLVLRWYGWTCCPINFPSGSPSSNKYGLQLQWKCLHVDTMSDVRSLLCHCLAAVWLDQPWLVQLIVVLLSFPPLPAPCGLGSCRISPPRFLAECGRSPLNQGSFVVLFFCCLIFLGCT